MNFQKSYFDLHCLNVQSPTTRGRWWKRARPSVLASIWLYAGVIFCVWPLLRFGGDRWWLATILLFGPRWFFAVPLPFLVLAAAVFWRRGLWLLLVSLVILLVPIMGFCFPWRCFGYPHGPEYRVLTCNIDGNACDKFALLNLITQIQPDFIALQECNDAEVLSSLDNYHVVRQGELIVASRFPLQLEGDLSGPIPLHVYPRLYILACIADTPQGKMAICSIHLPSARYGLSHVLDKTTILSPSKSGLLNEQIALRREQSLAVASFVKKLSYPLILAGDFNMPEESTIYRDNWSEYPNAFSQAGLGFGHTFTGEVRGIPFGIRIDHILCGKEWGPSHCWVGPDVGSDHMPLITDLLVR